MALLAVGAASLVLAGCSPSPVDKQIQSSRSAVLPVIKRVYHQLYDAHIVWSDDVQLGASDCGDNDPLVKSGGQSEVQYSAWTVTVPYAATNRFSYTVPFNVPEFAAQVADELDKGGWKLRLLSEGDPTHPLYSYALRSDGLDIAVKVDEDSGDSPFATIYVSGACFDAGSSAQKLTTGPSNDTVNLPHPTSRS